MKRKAKLSQMIEQKAKDVKRLASTSFVAPHSANIPRSGDVVDRLYNLAATQSRHKDELIALANSKGTYDESSGQKLFQVIAIIFLLYLENRITG